MRLLQLLFLALGQSAVIQAAAIGERNLHHHGKIVPKFFIISMVCVKARHTNWLLEIPQR